MNGSIGYPTRHKPTAQRDEGTQGTLKRSGREGEREAISVRVTESQARQGRIPDMVLSTRYKVQCTSHE